MPRKLDIAADKERAKLEGINRFKETSYEYSETNPDALSDGDEQGKGENSGSVGGKTDILTRAKSVARNQYNENNEYK